MFDLILRVTEFRCVSRESHFLKISSYSINLRLSTAREKMTMNNLQTRVKERKEEEKKEADEKVGLT